MNTKITFVAAVVAASFSASSYADHDIETITVTGQKNKLNADTELATGSTISPDAASWLEAIPGAGVNRNGGVTGIAQYRGLYGDRVSVKMNGHHLIGSGPNAMDTPLSYAVPIMIESMTAYRGITPVHVGMDTLGGAIDVELKQAELANNGQVLITGIAQAGFAQEGDAQTLSGVVNAANKTHGILLYLNNQDSDNVEDADDRIIPSTFYDKQQYGLDYRVNTNSGVVGFGYHKTDTDNSGTAALPMDIEYIEADRFDVSGEHQFAQWSLDWSVGYLDSKHGMDNHTMRSNMMTPMFRLNTAEATSTDFKIQLRTNTEFGHLIMGVDGYVSEHDSIITSASNPMFNVKNFFGVEDNRIGAYVHLDKKLESSQLGLGLRIKHNSADADQVSHHMAMMNPNIMALQSAFNSADRSQSETNFDLAANWTKNISEHSQILLGAGIKQKAPSYQERYLWVPMQATGGLADGHTYIGNIELDSETAYQLNAGLSLQERDFGISPNVFYQRIDDYIQGTPSMNMPANMVGTMMAGMAPLQFANIDAELYGVDITARYRFSSDLTLTGIAAYTRGKRKDIEDDLYRIAAPNVKLNATYFADNWQANLAWQVFASQDKVSAINTEVASAGYGLVNTSLVYYLGGLSVEVGVNNLFDKLYRDHIAGTNRVSMAEVAQGEKLPGTGRDLYVKLDYQF